MLFRLKNHLIWTPEDFPFTHQSWTKMLLTDLIRPSGFKIFADGSATRGEIKTAKILYKIRTQLCQIQNPFLPFIFLSFLSLSLGFHYSLSSPTLHLSFPPPHSSPHKLDPGFGLPSPESSRKDGLFEASRR